MKTEVFIPTERYPSVPGKQNQINIIRGADQGKRTAEDGGNDVVRADLGEEAVGDPEWDWHDEPDEDGERDNLNKRVLVKKLGGAKDGGN